MRPPAQTYISSPYLWDYKIRREDLAKPAVSKFWLERKINFCDWSGIKKKDLRAHWPDLDIRPELKNLLSIFLNHE